MLQISIPAFLYFSSPVSNIFHADRDDSPVSLQALLDFPEYFPNEDFLERRLEMERVRIVEPGRAPTPNNLFFKNEKIPEELRWDEFEENIQGILNPELADKMKELRNRICEAVDIKEATMAGTAQIPNKAAFLPNRIPKTRLIIVVAITNIISNRGLISFIPCGLNRFSRKCTGFLPRFSFSMAEVGSFSVISKQ